MIKNGKDTNCPHHRVCEMQSCTQCPIYKKVKGTKQSIQAINNLFLSSLEQALKPTKVKRVFALIQAAGYGFIETNRTLVTCAHASAGARLQERYCAKEQEVYLRRVTDENSKMLGWIGQCAVCNTIYYCLDN
jgi:hypothetical protein